MPGVIKMKCLECGGTGKRYCDRGERIVFGNIRDCPLCGGKGYGTKQQFYETLYQSYLNWNNDKNISFEAWCKK